MNARFETEDETEDPLLGKLIAGRYVLEEELGRGGAGVVYRARHVELGSFVAIKTLHPFLADDDGCRARLLAEARLAAALRSDHVVRVIDVGDLDATRMYVAFDYVRGSDLAQVLLLTGALPVSEALRYALDVCSALAEAHSHGIVHRDIKPENLLLECGKTRPRIKVSDFGIALRAGLNAPDAPGHVGTPWYMAPEQIIDSSDVDARADVWSLGVVLYEMLTGTLPFDGADACQVYPKILRAEPMKIRELRPEVPRELAEVVERCLEKQRKDRYPDVAELATELGRLGTVAHELQAADAALQLGAVEVHFDGWTSGGRSAPKDSDAAQQPLSTPPPLTSRLAQLRGALAVASCLSLIALAALVEPRRAVSFGSQGVSGASEASTRGEKRETATRAHAKREASSAVAPKAVDAPAREAEAPRIVEAQTKPSRAPSASAFALSRSPAPPAKTNAPSARDEKPLSLPEVAPTEVVAAGGDDAHAPQPTDGNDGAPSFAGAVARDEQPAEGEVKAESPAAAPSAPRDDVGGSP